MLIWPPVTSLSEEAGTVTYARAGHSDRRVDYNEALVSRLQRALRRRGYYGGRISGFLGQDTQEAIARFQVEAGDAVSAVPDRSLLVSLGLIRRHKPWASSKKSHRTQSPFVKNI
jgi:peptidoglycan hydrolase-like protein with peptidoglycan-binding domain